MYMCDCNKHCYTPSIVEEKGIYMYDQYTSWLGSSTSDLLKLQAQAFKNF